MLKAIIFDFDGVVVDTDRARFNALSVLLRKRGLVLRKREFPHFSGEKTTFFLAEKFPSLSKKEIEKIAEERRKEERKHLKSIRLVKGIRQVVEYAKKGNVKIGISTGSHRDIVERILKLHKLNVYVDILVSGEDFKSSKPNPECYTLAVSKLKVKPKECIVIEDAIAGVLAGKAAGCKTIGLCTYLSKKQLSMADVQCKGHQEVLKYLKENLRKPL